MKKNRAFLKWAGGKYPLLDDIKKHLPEGECLIEPFVGAGSVFLNTDFSRYILADINSDLIGLYNIVKLRTDEYVAAAREMFTPENNVAERYYQYRAPAIHLTASEKRPLKDSCAIARTTPRRTVSPWSAPTSTVPTLPRRMTARISSG